MNRNVCARCGKPVYFAERKTSLGRDWHPTCLKCYECGRVLSPGQHAEHKSNPYCHTPCYQALFGPPLLGYGSNLASRANFAKGPAEYGHDYEDDVYKREIYSNSRVTAIRRQKQIQSVPPSILNHDFSVPTSVSRSNSSNSARPAKSMDVKSSPSKSPPTMKDLPEKLPPRLRDILEKVEAFNNYYDGKVHHQMTVEQLPNGEVQIQGPLRIYWGLSRPIQLRQCDDIPNPPIAKWRHSLCVNVNNSPQQNTAPLRSHDADGLSPRHPLSPTRPKHGVDDSVLASPASTDDVIMRRRNIRKFNTVAYRSDAPTKWKRASINGHIFNYDTSVFTPVLGSSTSVIVDSTMTSPAVIQTLLEKFKVENSPSEYVLSVVSDNTERLLGEDEKPLLERLQLGADDQGAKIFLKERQMAPNTAISDTPDKLPIMEEEEETLPEEVEQLLILPIAALKGVLKKYHHDEEHDVRVLKAKFERVRRKIKKRMEELRTA